MEDIRITLETLYDILMTEKKREDLQKLNETFYYDVVVYMKEKTNLLNHKKAEDDLFVVGEKEKLEQELKSIRRILKEIYEKREKKILDIALNRSRTQSNIIDTSAMLREEKEFYDFLIKLFDTYREGVLSNLSNGEIPFFQKPNLTVKEPLVTEPEKPLIEDNKVAVSDTPPLQLKKIQFTHHVPSFIWKDLKEYGPFEPEEEVEIYSEVADLIIEKGRAKEIFPNS